MSLIFLIVFTFFQRAETSPYNNQPGLTKDEQAGKLLMETKCIKCHSAKVITDYTLQKWEKTLPKMIRKSKLGPIEQMSIMSYVQYILAQKK